MPENPPRRRRAPPLPLPVMDQLAERRIQEALENGAFEDLPGAGAPLKLDDDAMVPEQLRAAYRVLKNSGYVPAEVEALRDLREIEQALEHEREESKRNQLIGKLNMLLARAGIGHKRSLVVEHDYYHKIAEKLGAPKRR